MWKCLDLYVYLNIYIYVFLYIYTYSTSSRPHVMNACIFVDGGTSNTNICNQHTFNICIQNMSNMCAFMNLSVRHVPNSKLSPGEVSINHQRSYVCFSKLVLFCHHNGIYDDLVPFKSKKEQQATEAAMRHLFAISPRTLAFPLPKNDSSTPSKRPID